jgi:mono/diheme cytochrome c family protein
MILVLLLFMSVQGAPADVAQGKKLFDGMCARCHRWHRRRGAGAQIVPRWMGAATRPFATSFDGIPDRGCPASGASPSELQQLVAYVRSLGRTAARRPRNAERGRASPQQLRESCHIVKGRGGSFVLT